MFKLCFIGAGSTVFAKNLIGDCLLTPELGGFEAALYDIDPVRLEESRLMLENLRNRYNKKAVIKSYGDLGAALSGASFVINAVQVGGYMPCTVTDFDIPKKYGLRQTIGDTLGIGGIFRALRTIPVIEGFAAEIHKQCPDALFLNYSNPMAMLSGYMQRYLGINTIGLCHSVQVCAKQLLESVGMGGCAESASWKIAGINHQAWLLEICDGEGNDLYPEIKRRSRSGKYAETMKTDLVRHDIMQRFGFYTTESSEHAAEYLPYYIKSAYPELIDRYNIPLDEYLTRCVNQIASWKEMRETLTGSGVTHEKTFEFGSYILRAVLTDQPYRVHGNVLNSGLIPNLPRNACVEVACLIDRNGVNPCYAEELPEQCAALNRTNINVQSMTVEAARERSLEKVYMAAFLDPHTSSELSTDEIVAMCDELIEAHGDWLPKLQ